MRDRDWIVDPTFWQRLRSDRRSLFFGIVQNTAMFVLFDFGCTVSPHVLYDPCNITVFYSFLPKKPSPDAEFIPLKSDLELPIATLILCAIFA